MHGNKKKGNWINVFAYENLHIIMNIIIGMNNVKISIIMYFLCKIYINKCWFKLI